MLVMKHLIVRTNTIVLIVTLAWVSSCTIIPQAPKEYPPIVQLVVDETAFPEGWVADEPDTDFPPLAPWSSGRDEVEYVARTYDAPSGIGSASLKIQRFSYPQAAFKEYKRSIDIVFRDTEWNTPWTVPTESAFKSTTADQYRYGCSMEGGEGFAQPRCAYVAQYKVYTLEFYIALYNTNVITCADLVPILQTIDEHVSLYVTGDNK
jgi:hypothetical protein